MSLFNSKSSTEKPHPTWFVAERGGVGTTSLAHHSRAAALDDFTATLIYADHGGEPFSPHDRGRRLIATGPDWCRQPDDPTDPLVVGDAAVRSVLTAEEYSLIVHGTVAQALLES